MSAPSLRRDPGLRVQPSLARRLALSRLGKGRDHNAGGFTTWLAGAGLKLGIAFGQTDEFGDRSVEDAVSIADFHATVLHLLGIDHERLTYGRVVRGLLA